MWLPPLTYISCCFHNNAYKNSIILTKILSNTVKYLKNIEKILNTENKNVKILVK